MPIIYSKQYGMRHYAWISLKLAKSKLLKCRGMKMLICCTFST